jgi:hypothetical protein
MSSGLTSRTGLEGILGPDGNRCRDLALLISRIFDPVSKLATARAFSPATASSSHLYARQTDDAAAE